ncbi:calmodulin-binding receptor-like cytoplasmic kinase 1 isoform X2 [Punica granatum]|uniref:non-specific serine/threonine protein kinase n=1 Tax=Punica granatum TaxID=22663 RepID=A0A6P8C095_PUNGR|nr:calmodulin-binding receptor-like cytoplasmic kinase 1 isoform X2 [Punica granatum]XP_031401861.1 calmodulin-binding receptor-like cytoplasmic kinase 1 isoform X2 [Punica granatum]
MRTPPTATNNPNQRPGRGNPTSDLHRSTVPNRKNRSFADYFKLATKKASGLFAIFLLRRKRTPPEGSIAESGSKNDQVTAVSSSTDASTGSNPRSLSKLRPSFSASSTSTAASGPVGSSNFSFEEVLKATENFSSANVTGEGGFGTVYKGKLKNGSPVAVKRARKNIYDQRTSSDFKNEVLTLSQIEHLNLVRLYGYLEHGDERVMVVEYVSNGTLREHLDGVRGNGLEMAERLDIAIDVAHAVTYLHTYTDPPIIHRDIKASNILITEKLRAKVADFGFARSATEGSDATHISTQIKGSTGYVDPEYLRTYQLSPKSDVYSFGVLLVEMMTGRHPIESKRPLHERTTIKWAMQKLKNRESVLAMDWRIRRNPASVTAHEEVLKLARQCLAPTRHSRPPMRKCVEILWGIRKEFKERTSSALLSASHHSANFPNRDAKDHRHTSFGIEEESHKFVSA